MKRIIAISLCVLMCVCCFSSCASSRLECLPPDGANLNYNNADSVGFWLTSDSVCYTETPIFSSHYYLAQQDSNTKIGWGDGAKIQRYGNQIYILNDADNIDEENTTRKLKLYNVDSKKTTTLTSMNNCYKFLVLDETVYYSDYSWVDGYKVWTLKKYSTVSGEHETIKEKIVSFGVIKNDIFYLSDENDKIIIYKYDSNTEASIEQGEIYLSKEDILRLPDFGDVSYTPNYLLLNISDEPASRIFKYSFSIV